MIPYPVIDPVFFRLGPFELRWYGLAYMVSVAVVFKLISKTLSEKFKLNSDAIISLMTYFVFGIVLGGRLGYILFYDLPYYLSSPGAVFAVWQGGMSFHGGGLGAMVGVGLFARRHKVSMWGLFDLMALTSTLGLFLGRLANFVNAELYGRVTDVAWGMVFPGGGPLPRHPSQLYEAFFEGIVMFLILFVLYRKQLLKPGQLLAVFIALYGVFRFFIEYFRQPDAHLGFVLFGWSMGQILCVVMTVSGIGLFIYRASVYRQKTY